MNESLQKAVAVMIEKAISGVEAATNFLAAEIPDVVHQLLMWHMVKSAVVCAIGVMLIPCSVLILKWAFKDPVLDEENSNKYRKAYKATVVYDTDGKVTPSVVPVCTVSAFPVIIGFCMLNIEWLQIWIAPKVWLIEYAAKLVK